MAIARRRYKVTKGYVQAGQCPETGPSHADGGGAANTLLSFVVSCIWSA